ncbi:MAG TPA: tRNA 2-thiouridine(34) synthase MnmA [Bacilli bacterium]|nr:tRNA 2-thiouridine(34) synthase MnmA [Bacilli bacterium]
MKKRVVVGLSGGVDSAVAAYLLKKEGYDVIGLFMRNWDSSINNDTLGNPNINNNICPQEQDYNDAQEVANKLGIPLHRVDFIKEYWDDVFTYFLKELKLGRTPNPDLMCNKYIKFDLFVKEALKYKADYIATGHYAKTKDNHLYRGTDRNKDQSYFLAQLSSKQLNNVLFPVGDLTKTEVRKIANEIGLNVAIKKDSTGICFIGERNYQAFLKNYLKPNPGEIIDIETNKVVGEHTGLMNYTIGQRKNVGLSGDKERHFVVGKDIDKNILYVAFKEDNRYLYSDACLIDSVNFISDKRPEKCTAKFRYRSTDIPVNLEYLDNNTILVKYPNKAKAVTPGQACVLYLEEECLGSGIIKEIYKNNTKLWYL